MLKKNSEIIQLMYQAAAQGDMETALAALDENLVVHEQESLPYGGRYVGSAGFQKLFENLAAVWKDFNFAPQEILDAGDDVVIAVVRLTGTARATGKSLDMTMYELWRMSDGKAAECRSIVWDTARMLEILGEKR